jgi:hypothetical protein
MIGYHGDINRREKRSEVKLDEDERIVGIVSHNHGDCWHFNFQFILAKPS